MYYSSDRKCGKSGYKTAEPLKSGKHLSVQLKGCDYFVCTKKKYNLNKIDGYSVNNNVDIYSIINLPIDIEKKDICNHLENYNATCINQTKIGDLFVYDYVGYPVNTNDSSRNLDFNFKEIGKNYNDCKLTIVDLFNLSKADLDDLYLGLSENTDIQIDVTNCQLYHLVKYICLFSGNSFNSIYKDGKLLIKFSKSKSIIHNNFIWTKIKSMKKTDLVVLVKQ